MTALETFGAYVAQDVRGRVTPQLRDTVGLHVIDTVAAWVATAAMPEARHIAAYREKMRAEVSGPALDIMADCALVRMSEIDSIHLASMITPGAFVVPAALSIAAARPQTDVQTLLEAMIAGYEAMVRLGEALDGPTILYRGIWPSNFAAAFGVAAASARLMNLTPEQTAHALALSLTTSAPGVGNVHGTATSRWLAAGLNARQGYVAALATAQGFVSDTGLMEGNYLNSVFGITPKAAALTDNLGTRDTVSEISFKPWCAARQTMAATQAFTEVIAAGVSLDTITAVDVAVPPSFLRMVDHGINEADRMSRLTSVQYQMAVAALHPEMAFDVGQTAKVPADITALMGKIKVAADDKPLDGFPAIWPGRVTVHAANARHERVVTHVPGDRARPFSKRDVADKFHKVADRVVGASRVDALIAASQRMLDGGLPAANLLAAVHEACNPVPG